MYLILIMHNFVDGLHLETPYFLGFFDIYIL